MFERFSPRARHVVVLAQEEARTLRHNYIGTEHVLLGLLGEPEGIGARALARFGMSLAAVRTEVAELVAPGKKAAKGHIPFTPRSKKVLELALREALSMGHNYIGTEHVLLGVIREGEGIGAQVIRAHVDDLLKVRMAVLDLIPTQASETAPRWLRQPDPGVMAGAGRGEELRTTPAADASLNAAVRLAGPQPVGSHHLLLAALDDPRSAAFRALVTLGIDLDRARTALREVDVTDTNDEPPEEAGRRQMLIRATENQLIIETTDRTLLELAHAAIAAAGAESDQPGTIRGDRPDSASLGRVWQSLRDSLEDIRRRASAQSSVAGQEQEQEPVEGKGSGAVEDEPAEPRGAAEG